MEDRVDGAVEEDVLRHVVEDEAELPVPGEVRDVPLVARDQVVEADDLVTVGQEPVREVAPEEPRATGDHDVHQSSPDRPRSSSPAYASRRGS